MYDFIVISSKNTPEVSKLHYEPHKPQNLLLYIAMEKWLGAWFKNFTFSKKKKKKRRMPPPECGLQTLRLLAGFRSSFRSVPKNKRILPYHTHLCLGLRAKICPGPPGISPRDHLSSDLSQTACGSGTHIPFMVPTVQALLSSQPIKRSWSPLSTSPSVWVLYP